MTTIPIRQLQVLDNRHAPGIIALIFGASKMRFCSQLFLPNAFFTLAHFSVTFYILCPPPPPKSLYIFCIIYCNPLRQCAYQLVSAVHRWHFGEIAQKCVTCAHVFQIVLRSRSGSEAPFF